MGFIDNLRAVFRKAAPKSEPRNFGAFFVPSYQAGQPASWATDKAEEVKHFKHWAYAAISAIASRIAAAELHLYKQGGEDQEEISDHPFLDLLYDVNPFKTKFDLWWETVMFLELTGDAYWYLPPNKLGVPGEIWTIPSHWMHIIPDKAAGISHYEYRMSGATEAIRYEAGEVVHFRYPSPVDTLYGYSPLRAAAEAVDTHESIKTAQYNAFKQGIYPGGVLTTDQKLEPDTVTRIQDSLKKRYGGPEKAGKIFVLEQGLSYAKMSLTPQEMDFGESSKILRDEILGIFKVPAAIAGLSEDVNRSSADALEVIFARNTIEPKLRMIEDAVNQYLLPKYDKALWCRFEVIIPEDALLKAQVRQIEIASGLKSINQVRAEMGLEDVAWGDEPWLPFSVMQPGGGGFEFESEKGQEETKAAKKGAMRRKLSVEMKDAIWKRFDRELAKRERAFTREITKEFKREKTEVLENWEKLSKAFTSVAEDLRQKYQDWDELNAAIHVETKQGTEDMLDDDKAARMLAEFSGKYYKAGINDGGLQEVDILRDLGMGGARFSPDAKRVLEYLKGKGRDYWKDTVTNTTVERLNDVISRGLSEGLPSGEIGDAIAEMFDSRAHNSMTIARTEMIGAANEGHQEAREQNGIEKKEWLSSRDQFVRDTHGPPPEGIDGEVVGNKEAFSNGLAYPGDPAGDISETANCRCLSIAHFE